MLVQALRDKLVVITAITNLLATYKFNGTTGTPAIFTINPMPEDTAYPAIMIYDTGGNSNFGTRSTIGANINATVSVYGNKQRDWTTIKQAAWLVWRALERQSLTITGFSTVMVRAQPPKSINDGIGFPGFVVEVTATVLDR
jgi:hypothetical protein